MLSGKVSEGKNTFEYNISFNEILLTPENVVKAMGYKPDQAPMPVYEEIDSIIDFIPDFTDIRAGFTILPPESFKAEKRFLSCCSINFETAPIITKRLRKSITIAIFTATAGPKITEWSNQLMSHGEMLKGYIIDIIGSEIVERAGDILENFLVEAIKGKNWNTTNRYSPGYCGWSVKEQHKLFSFLPENFCGIKLTESALMIPIKSISGFIGLGPDVKKEDYECSLCDIEFCYKRKKVK